MYIIGKLLLSTNDIDVVIHVAIQTGRHRVNVLDNDKERIN